MNEVYVSYNGTLYVAYIAVYMFHGYTGTLYVAYMNAIPEKHGKEKDGVVFAVVTDELGNFFDEA